MPDCVIGFQEALVRQVRDLAELLGSDWSWVRLNLVLIPFGAIHLTASSFKIGVGRDDGIEAGEFCPIFYRK